MVSFHQREGVRRVLNRPGVERSILIAYFETHLNMPAVYCIRTFLSTISGTHRENMIRRAPKNHLRQIERVVCANLAEGECYYLRVLLNHVPGATSFPDLTTVSDKHLPTFYEATKRRGLIEVDNTLHEGLAKATLWMMPYALRRLFATILVFL
jgi:hypothetical protein